MDGLLASGALSHGMKKGRTDYLAAETQSPTIGALISQIVQVLVVNANLHMYQLPDELAGRVWERAISIASRPNALAATDKWDRG
jgi:hypothetical protein